MGPSRLALGEAVENAGEQVERALVGLMRSNADGNAFLSPKCQLVLLS